MASSLIRGWAVRVGAVVLALGLTGCASTGKNAQDPFEGFNRAMFSFNDKVDETVLKPSAEAYQSVLPQFVQTGIGNFFSNIGDIPTLANEVLQGKFRESLSDVMRIAVNSTLGFGGLLDIASEANLPKHSEDFGQTLGRWGVGPGPYVVLPVFGPSTVRDSAALPLDFAADPWLRTYPVKIRNTGSVVRVIDQRAVALNASNLVEEAALDRYEFVRDAYLQRRESRIFDGDAPPPKKDKGASLDDEDGEKRAESAAPPPAPAPAAAPEPAARGLVKEEQPAAAAATPAVAPVAVPADAPKMTLSSDTAPRQLTP